MFYIVLLQAAASIMRKVDRPPTNPKRLIIESSQECFSVDIPRSTDMADPTNTLSDGDLRSIERRALQLLLKTLLCLMWMMMMTLSHPKRSAISQWMPQIRRRWVYNIAEIYHFQYFIHASNHNAYLMCFNIQLSILP